MTLFNKSISYYLTLKDLFKAKSSLFLKVFFITTCLFTINITLASSKTILLNVQLNKNHYLYDKLTSLAKTIEKNTKSYDSTNKIDYWENETTTSLDKLLQSFGYYENTIEVTKESTDKNTILNFEIRPGERYKVENISIKFKKDSNENIHNINIDQLKTKIGEYINAATVQEDQKIILKYIEQNNCLLNLSISHEATIDYLSNTIHVTFLIKSGPTAKVKTINFKGLETLDENYLRKLITIEDGKCFKQSYLATIKSDLQKPNLFSSINYSVPSDVDKKNEVPILLSLEERKPRDIKLGINYITGDGLSGIFGWQHRNVWGRGENVKVNLNANKSKQSFEFLYTQPFFLADDQTFRFENKYINETLSSFDNKKLDFSLFLDKEISKKWSIGIGSQISYSDVQELDNISAPQYFHLLSFPTYIIHDRRDNIFNTKSGSLAKFEAESFIPIEFNQSTFTKLQLHTNFYYTLHNSLTMALKASGGSFLISNTSQVPLNEKFFVGGAGSVRGYGSDLAGDLDPNFKTKGGNSFIEGSMELRFKLKNNYGLVGFVDCGYSYANKTPKLNKMLYGIGIGFRYYTNFGPLRVDIAMPVEKRYPGEKSFQLYLGIGQSF